jgi:2-C-methyl-D-erythritol 4-phosphate cytidylyltransferase
MMSSTTWAVIIASGKGEQFAPDVDTAFVNLGSKPVITYSLSVYEHCPEVDGIVIVAPKDRVENLRAMMQMFGCYKVKRIVAGTGARQNSVLAGLRAIDDDVSVVSIHDSSRPCVTGDQVSETIKMAKRYGCGVIATKITEAVIESAKGFVASGSVDAEKLWLTATPQAFKFDLIVKALELAQKKKMVLHDDSEAMALIKEEVRLVPATKPTLRIATPADLHLAEWLLRH